MEERKIDNPLVVPDALSFLTYRAWTAEVKGLDAFPQNEWPTNIALLYYSYHIMVGLGTIFIAIMVMAAFLLWRGKLFGSRWMLWILLLALPFPYIANTAGWMTAEIGRQPWLCSTADAHRGWLLEDGVGREWHVHVAGIHGHVHGSENLLPVPGSPGDRAGPGRDSRRGALISLHSNEHSMLVIPRSKATRNLLFAIVRTQSFE